MELRDNVALTREASTSLEVNLERRIAAFRRSLADLGQAAAGIQEDVAQAISAAQHRQQG